jgi:hypothetical protein
MVEELGISANPAHRFLEPKSARISATDGVTRWVDPSQTVDRDSYFREIGKRTAKLNLMLPIGKIVALW